MSGLSQVDGMSAAVDNRAQAATELAVRDWLETQARIASYWRDLLVDRNGDIDLIEALDTHETFLRAVAR